MRFAMASGKMIDINNISSFDIDLGDLAHNLSKIQRFNGAIPLNLTYSVGEHCINLCNYVLENYDSKLMAAYALLHDSSEAYLSDILSPVKKNLPDYCLVESNVIKRIMFCFPSLWSIDETVMENISRLDKRILIDEVETIMPDKLDIYVNETKIKKLGCHIMYNNHPSTVKRCFLTMAKKLL